MLCKFQKDRPCDRSFVFLELTQYKWPIEHICSDIDPKLHLMTRYFCRPYQHKDYPRNCDIHDAARLDELRLSNLQEAFIPLRIAAAREGLFEYQLLVAEMNGRVDGFVAFSASELTWLYVNPDCYRTGIGSLLAQAAIDRSGSEIFLEVISGNEPALAFYRSVGFEHVHTASGAMPGNEAFRITAHVMSYDKTKNSA